MISIEDLKRRRCEWHRDSLDWIMLDSADCVHRVVGVYPDAAMSSRRWAVSWTFIESFLPGSCISSRLYETPEAAMAWVDVAFCDHFNWFEVA